MLKPFARLLRDRRADVLAMPFLAIYACGFYWSAIRCGLVSDGWALLHIGSLPLRQAVSTRLAYHFIPGTHLLNAVQWRLLGLHDSWYQLANLAALVLVAAA